VTRTMLNMHTMGWARRMIGSGHVCPACSVLTSDLEGEVSSVIETVQIYAASYRNFERQSRTRTTMEQAIGQCRRSIDLQTC
jgi:hypothetical protein